MSLMAGAVPAPAAPRPTPAPGLIQRCGGIDCPSGTCGHTDDPADATVRRSADAAGAAGGRGVPASVLQVLTRAGAPLDPSAQAGMEARLGHGFGHVRVHADDMAAQSARDIGAAAYTFGRHIVMGAGNYQPHTPAGSRLLAHELAHVVQQQAWPVPPGRPTMISSPHDPAERAADDIAGRVAPDPGGPRDTFRAAQAADMSIARQVPEAAGPDPAAMTARADAPEDDIMESLPGDDAFDREFGAGVSAMPRGTTEAASATLPAAAPLDSFVTPEARYAVALTSAFVSGGGYAPPAGLLATEALASDAAAAQAVSAAETLLTAQGLTASATVVARGASLAESLTAAGEGILVFEAAGGAEAEAAIPVGGWIAGAIVLVAAGGLLLAGYLLRQRRHQPSQAQPVPQAEPRAAADAKTGDCTEERHEALQAEVERDCKNLPRSCRPGMGKAQLKRQAFRNWRCARARDQVNQECFGGGDAGHQRAAQLAWEAYWRCWELYHDADRLR